MTLEWAKGLLYEYARRHPRFRRMLFRAWYNWRPGGRRSWLAVHVRCADSRDMAQESTPGCRCETIRGACTQLQPEQFLDPSSALPPLPKDILPPIYWTSFERPLLFNGGVVLTRDGRLPKDLCPDLATPPHWHRACELRRIPPAVLVPGPVTVLSALGTGYYHWLLDGLARLACLPGPPQGRVLIENTSAFQRAYLDLAGLTSERVLPVSAWSCYAPDRAIVPSLPGDSGSPPPETIHFLRHLRDRSRPRMQRPLTPASRRLFVTRPDSISRRLVNEHEVAAVLARAGFSFIDPGACTVLDQMQLFSDAEIVIGLHGGALANLCYCAPGTPVIELFPESYINPCFRRLCRSAGLTYGAIFCPTAPGARFSARMVADYCVPMARLEQSLRLAEKAIERRGKV